MIRIAVIITCFNRKEKTISCLRHLFSSRSRLSKDGINTIIEVFITDDGCTDGTSSEVLSIFPNEHIHIQYGDGDLFWAKGMNLSWKVAAEKGPWDYYLLLNDDTDMTEDCFVELFKAQSFSKRNQGKEALVSGIIASRSDSLEVTYGGEIVLNRFTAKLKKLGPNDVPQSCDWVNGNILFVPNALFEKIGFFYPYSHSCADTDYSVMAKRAGFPVFVTAGICGYCDFDHWTKADDREKIVKMTLKERIAYFSHPLHSNSDYLTMIRRIMPWRLPFVWLFRNMVVYAPSLYYWIVYRRYEQ